MPGITVVAHCVLGKTFCRFWRCEPMTKVFAGMNGPPKPLFARGIPEGLIELQCRDLLTLDGAGK